MDFNEPQSRNEAILQNILGANNVLVNPQSEIEAILQAILNNTPYTDEGRSRIARLLIAIKNNGTWNELPIISRNEEILYCILNGEKYTEEPQSRIEELLIAWSNAGSQGYEKTVSGNPISITDALAEPAVSLKVFLEPKQDLHGYDHPWPAGGGKNLFDESNAIVEYDLDRYCKLENGLLHYKNGGGSPCFSREFDIYLPSGSYVLSLSNYRLVSGVSPIWMIEIGSNPLTYPSTSTAYTFTLAEPDTVKIRLTTNGTNSATEFYGNVQLEAGSTATSYAPYSNICPITGWDEVSVTRAGKNKLKPYSYTVNTSGVTLTYSDDGTVNATGTATANIGRPLSSWAASNNATFTLKAGTYTLSLNTPKSGVTVSLNKAEGGGGIATTSTDVTFTTSEDFECFWRLNIDSGTVLNDTFTVQLESGSTATSYEPYQSETYTVSLTQAGTVYGGVLDVVSGELVVNRAEVDLGTLNWSIGYNGFVAQLSNMSITLSNTEPAKLLCSIYRTAAYTPLLDFSISGISNTNYVRVHDSSKSSLADFKAAMQGVQLVYELATPLTYQLTPTEVQMLLGYNTLTADAEMELTYKGSNPALQLSAMLKKNSNNLKSLKLKK